MMTIYLLSGTSAPWTGQIIVTEEEPAGMICTGHIFLLHGCGVEGPKSSPFDHQRALFLADLLSCR